MSIKVPKRPSQTSPAVTLQGTPTMNVQSGFTELGKAVGQIGLRIADHNAKVAKTNSLLKIDSELVEYESEILRKINDFRKAQDEGVYSLSPDGKFLDPNKALRDYDADMNNYLMERSNTMSPGAKMKGLGALQHKIEKGRFQIQENVTRDVKKNNRISLNQSQNVYMSDLASAQTIENAQVYAAKQINMADASFANNALTAQEYTNKKKKYENLYLDNALRISSGSSDPNDQLVYLINGGKVEGIQGDELESGDERYIDLFDRVNKKAKITKQAIGNIQDNLFIKTQNQIEEKLKSIGPDASLEEIDKALNDVEDILEGSNLTSDNYKKLQTFADNYYDDSLASERVYESFLIFAESGGLRGDMFTRAIEANTDGLLSSQKLTRLKEIQAENFKLIKKAETKSLTAQYKFIADMTGGNKALINEKNTEDGTFSFGVKYSRKTLEAFNLYNKLMLEADRNGINHETFVNTKAKFLGSDKAMTPAEFVVQTINSRAPREDLQNNENIPILGDDLYNLRINEAELFEKDGIYYKKDANDIIRIDMLETIKKNEPMLNLLSTRRILRVDMGADGIPIEIKESPEKVANRLNFYKYLKTTKITEDQLDAVANMFNVDLLTELQEMESNEAILQGVGIRQGVKTNRKPGKTMAESNLINEAMRRPTELEKSVDEMEESAEMEVLQEGGEVFRRLR